MRTAVLVVCGLLAACDERPADERVLEQHIPLESTESMSVDPDPKPDPSVDDRNAPVGPTAGSAFDLEQARATLARMIDARLERVDANIAALEQRGDSADAVALLRAKRDHARAKLGSLDRITHATWIAYKRDVYEAWDQLDREIEQAMR
jgi:hypothetical protein